MGKWRMTCGSANKTFEYQEENSNRLRNDGLERSRWLLCVVCMSIALVTWSSAEESEKCNSRCWKKSPSEDISFTDGIHRDGIDNEKACKDVCASNEACIGVYWGFNAGLNTFSCWLQTTAAGTSNKLTKAEHWIFAKCTDDCLTYCWKPKWDNVQTAGGIYHSMAESEEQCKKTCANDPMCDGVDWSAPEESCWLLYRHRRTRDQMTHWEIVRSLPTKCQKEEPQCMPHCWTKTVSPELSFNDGLFKKRIDNERNCKDICASNQTCIGVYWGFNPILNIVSCFLQMPFQVVSESLKEVNHWKLSNCTDDCLPYCWLPKWDFIHSLGGVYQYGIEDENWCKVTCTYAKKCNGIDFNKTDETCWLLYDTHLMQTPSKAAVNHWEIERNLPEICSNESSVLSETPAPAPAENPPTENAAPPETAAPAENAPPAENAAPQENAAPTETEPPEAPTAEPVAPAEEANSTETAGNETAAAGNETAAWNETTAGNETAAGNETEPANATEPVGGGGGGPAEAGESAVTKGHHRKKPCPSYLIGIVTLAVLMAVCVLIIIALITFIIARTLRDPGPATTNAPGAAAAKPAK